MSLRLPLLVSVVALFGFASAQAQFGVYGMVNGQRYGGINCPSFAAPCADNSGHGDAYGGTFGILYDIHDYGPVRLGADVRGAILTSNKRADSSAGGAGIFRQYEALAAVRGSVATPIRWLRPYAEVGFGFTRNNANGVYTETATINNTVSPPTETGALTFNPAIYSSRPLVKGFVGADVHLGAHLDIRPIEFGVGEAFGSTTTLLTTTNTVAASGTTSTSVAGQTSPSSHGIVSIGAGFVIRFP